MRLRGPPVILAEKLTAYLLVERRHNDKARFLARIGFTQDNPDALRGAILDLVERNDAVVDRQDAYGIFYRVEGLLLGPVGNLGVVTIWLERALDGEIRFVTLKPKR
jgi:hypothetical protein